MDLSLKLAFNPLFEIRGELYTNGPRFSQLCFQSSFWDSVLARFQRRSLGNESFNPLFEIPTASMRIRSITVSRTRFQSSFWDSPWKCRLWPGRSQCRLSILFLRFNGVDAPLQAVALYPYLSILFLRFLSTPSPGQLLLKHVPTAFNPLFEIPRRA